MSNGTDHMTPVRKALRAYAEALEQISEHQTLDYQTGNLMPSEPALIARKALALSEGQAQQSVKALPPVVTGQMEIEPDVTAADLGVNAEPGSVNEMLDLALSVMNGCVHDGGFDREIGPIGCDLGDKCVCIGVYPLVAKAAAQSDFEARIRSALLPQPAVPGEVEPSPQRQPEGD